MKPPQPGDDDGLTVEYAADLAIDHYLPAFDSVSENETVGDTKQTGNGAFSLRNVHRMQDSFFQITQTKADSISGIVVPWAYVASKYSTFCWHTEDLFLYSFNYMHEGGCKIWYTVPYEDVQKVRDFMLEKYKEDLKKRPTLLDEVVLFFSPVQLLKAGVGSILTDSDPGVQDLPGTW